MSLYITLDLENAILCPVCNIKKSPPNFAEDKRRKNGLYYCCRVCKNKQDRENYAYKKKLNLRRLTKNEQL